MQCNAMEKKNEGLWYRPIGILGGRDEWKMVVDIGLCGDEL